MTPEDKSRVRAQFVQVLQDNLGNKLTQALAEGMLLCFMQGISSLDKQKGKPKGKPQDAPQKE